MDAQCKEIVWSQFGAAIDTLENAIVACPDEYWGDRDGKPGNWYLVFHTLFWLDYYLADSREGFAPPAPFGLEEMNPAGVLPPRVYTKEEMLGYLEHGRRKCRQVIATMTDSRAREQYSFGKLSLSILELQLYNMRHVQHHAAQFNLILRQTIDSAPRWVFKSKTAMESE